jgi:hypothetical protein
MAAGAGVREKFGTCGDRNRIIEGRVLALLIFVSGVLCKQRHN